MQKIILIALAVIIIVVGGHAVAVQAALSQLQAPAPSGAISPNTEFRFTFQGLSAPLVRCRGSMSKLDQSGKSTMRGIFRGSDTYVAFKPEEPLPVGAIIQVEYAFVCRAGLFFIQDDITFGDILKKSFTREYFVVQ